MTIIWPVFAMVALTVATTYRLALKRVTAIKARRVDVRFFKSYRGYDEPEDLAVASRNLLNLFETPMLFYVVAVLIYVTGQASGTLVALAWLYVATRYLHSYIHLTTNAVVWRFRVFGAGFIILTLIWVVFGAQLAFSGAA
ncbi:MAG: MAPEG family protein [Gammaproteobacteria bacterium]